LAIDYPTKIKQHLGIMKNQSILPSVEAVLKQYIQENCLFEGEILPHHKIYDDLNLDSLDFLEIELYFEEIFGICADNDIDRQIETFEELVAAIKEKHDIG
jgi:acyl carrier protein